MFYDQDIDTPLHFDDTPSRPYRIRNATILDNRIIPDPPNDPHDNVTAYTSHIRKEKQLFGTAFGKGGGEKAKNYNKAVARQLKHKVMYAPVKIIKPNDL